MATAETRALPPPSEQTRPRTIMVAASLASGAVFMFFVGLVSFYASQRSSALQAVDENGLPAPRRWLPADDISIVPGNVMMFTMVMSAITMYWAVHSLRNNDRVNAYVAMGLTALFGLAVINQTIFYYIDIGLPIDAGGATTFESAAPLFYVITGAHLAMIGVAVLMLALLGFRALAGQFSDGRVEAVSAAAIFWYTTVAVYLIVWYAIYITK